MHDSALTKKKKQNNLAGGGGVGGPETPTTNTQLGLHSKTLKTNDFFINDGLYISTGT